MKYTICLVLILINFSYLLSQEKDLDRRAPFLSDFEVNLETPQASLENFLISCRNENWEQAASSLNFKLFPGIKKLKTGELAEKLHFVLNQELWIDWRKIPDRPDGAVEPVSITKKESKQQSNNNYIQLGDISLDNRLVPIYLEKVRLSYGNEVWLFSAQTVENIDSLYEVHGPSEIAKNMPSWAMKRGWMKVMVWQFILLGICLIVFPIIGLISARMIVNGLLKAIPVKDLEIIKKLQKPLVGIISSFLLYITIKWLIGLPSNLATFVEPLCLILFITMVVWMIMKFVSFGADYFIENTKNKYEEQDLHRRKIITQITISKHIVYLISIFLGLVIVLIQLNSFRVIGIALLSSAGAMAVIIGIAGHAVLGNLINGIQIAFMQPFKIGDSVFIENNWGRIEQVSYVDVIVKTWDNRRLIFPINYFTENWFENWSKNDEFLTKIIRLKLDYRTDVSKVREQFLKILEEEENWVGDEDDPKVYVTECTDETITVRLTCSADNPSKAWELICSVREKILSWINKYEDGLYLPHRRIILNESE